ncbi:hypothetical protein LINPERPRIM_LOCUS35911 [Linum perenne]
MAGLQYNFFPTDFFYPRPKSVAGTADAAALKSSLPLPIKNRSDDEADSQHPTRLILHTSATKSAAAAVEDNRRKKY